jgi:hypothetical protein
MRRGLLVLLTSGSVAFATAGANAPPAQASLLCGAAGLVSGLAGKACTVVTGPVGGVIKKVLGGGGSSASSHLTAAAEVLALGVAAAGAADATVKIVAKAIGETTSPQLTSTWFSGTYWRISAIAALLALPFLFAAAVQALMRSDITLLIRSAFGYLPLAALVTAIAAPLTMLLLAASDEMSAIVSSAAPSGHHFLEKAALFTGLFAVARHSPFLLIAVATLALMFGVAVWLELAVREAAVYVIVLMLPLMFSAMVWPARRVWAIRAVEILVALILSKFVIVAVLSLGSGALGSGVVSAIAGIALLMLAAFSPWMLLRLLPMAEMAGAAAGSLGERLRSHGSTGIRAVTGADPVGHAHQTMRDLGGTATAWMRNQATGADGVQTSRAGSYTGSGGSFGGGASSAAGGGGSGAGAPGGSGGNGSAEAPANGAAPVPVGAPVAAHGASGGDEPAGERSPGLGAAFQTPDGTHDLVLGPDHYPHPPPVIPADPADEPGPGEDHDLRPEGQPEPEDY